MNNKGSLADEFKKHLGVHEYEGIVADIQKWFYGSLVKASWCATSTSFFMNQLGLLSYIGGKNENVCMMMESCKKYAETHDDVEFFDRDHLPETIRKDDICFWLWSGTKMTTTSSKHVATCYQDSCGDSVCSIGGNQQDSICIANYPKQNLYAVYRYKAERDYMFVGWHSDTHKCEDGESVWWYADTLHSYYKDCWQNINGSRYYFNSRGYAVKGLHMIGGKPFYFEDTPGAKKECALMTTSHDGSLTSLFSS